MGRNSRRFAYRLSVLAGAGALGTVLYSKWALRAGSACLPPQPRDPLPRSAHLQALKDSATGTADPFDVLVVGGGLVGLCTAIEAAQRGLRVAVVEAADFGGGAASHCPTLQPGALACVQRAVRQRDVLHVRRAVEALWQQAVWRNVLPSEWASFQRTLVPVLHGGELIELYACAALSSLLSLCCGPVRVCPLVSARAAARALPELRRETDAQLPYGGICSSDLHLRTAAAAVALARTAEALGVTVAHYTPVTGFELVHQHHGDGGAALVEAALVDTVGAGGRLAARARTVVNCGGAWADEVRAMAPGSAQGSGPAAVQRQRVYSYLVAPREAVSTGANVGDAGGATGLHLSSTRFSFSLMLVMPWLEGTVLLGPCLSALDRAPPRRGPETVVLRSPDGFESQRRFITAGLAAGGVRVDSSRVLSCLHCVTPLIKPPAEVPWVARALADGYHIVAPEAEAEVGAGAGDAAPFVHVYGGTATQARVVARAAVDAVVSRCGATLSAATRSRLRADGGTDRLRLVVPASLTDTETEEDTVQRVRAMARDAFVASLADVVFRRTAVAYTSPAEATAALPALARVLAEELGWGSARVAEEVRRTQRLIGAVAVHAGAEAQR